MGQRGALVTVADGFAMNVLIPQKKALAATPETIQKVEKETLAAKGKKDMDAALLKKALHDIEGKIFTLTVAANDTGGLFKAIHEREIGEALVAQSGISLPGNAFALPAPIKKTGTYDVPVSLHGIRASIKITVVAE